MELAEIHKINMETFQKELISDVDGRPFACKMYDSITGGDKDCADCLGENFAQITHTILSDFFRGFSPEPQTNIDFYFYTYLFWLSNFTSRVDFIFKLLGKGNKLFESYQKENFRTFADIRKWMNFIKHPKEFLFCHWPTYVLNESDIIPKSNLIKIDIDFIRKYYTHEDTMVESLERQDAVYVIIPDLIGLTINFCKEMNLFYSFICENKVVADYLKQKSTIQYFYDNGRPEEPTELFFSESNISN
jgi:hypothetical protein